MVAGTPSSSLVRALSTAPAQSVASEGTTQIPILGSPFAVPLFRNLWIAATFSNVGSTAHDAAAGAWMANHATSPVLVSAIATAASLPVFLLALPAGALADIVDRRRYLINIQWAMALVCAILGTVALLGHLTPWILLIATGVLGGLSAMATPAAQSMIPDLVPRPLLPQALAANSAGFNVARAVGPASGGLLAAWVGPGLVFLLNGLSFLALVLVLRRWQPAQDQVRLPPESFSGAVKAGWRYARHSSPFQHCLLRAAAFALPASALWSLLPLLARSIPGAGPAIYGILLGSLGAGALLAAFKLSALRSRLRPESIARLAALLCGAPMILLPHAHAVWVLVVLLIVAGAGWLLMMTTLNLAVQSELPAWVRARGLALHLLVFSGGMALGSITWGVATQYLGLVTAITLAAGLTLSTPMIGLILPYRSVDPEDRHPSSLWPEPVVAREIPLDQGPVLVTVEYIIDPQQAGEFFRAIALLKIVRLRDGAYRWSCHEDIAQPGRMIESFELDSWTEHLRQHQRVTREDSAIEAAVDAFHRGSEPPVVTHWLALRK